MFSARVSNNVVLDVEGKAKSLKASSIHRSRNSEADVGEKRAALARIHAKELICSRIKAELRLLA